MQQRIFGNVINVISGAAKEHQKEVENAELRPQLLSSLIYLFTRKNIFDAINAKDQTVTSCK